MRLALRLKEVRRQGWIDRGVADPESSADHSWAVALFAWLMARDRDELDHDRVMFIALVHDLPEALAGDATPFDRHRNQQGAIPPDYFLDIPAYYADESRLKHDRERAALQEMTKQLPASLAEQVIEAWEEYSSGVTPEAQFVRQIDKLETLLQAEHYHELQPEIVIDSFRSGTNRDVTDRGLRRLLVRILESTTGNHGSEHETNDQ